MVSDVIVEILPNKPSFSNLLPVYAYTYLPNFPFLLKAVALDPTVEGVHSNHSNRVSDVIVAGLVTS